MGFGEAKKFPKGKRKSNFYEKTLKDAKEQQRKDETLEKVVKAEEMPWDDSPQGRLKHLCNEHMDVRSKTMDIYIQEIAAGSHSGKHRHMADEFIFVLEGRGYDLHWDVDFDLKEKFDWKTSQEPQRFDWQEGDIVYIPVNTVHQHFNSDPDSSARFISASNRIYKAMGYNDLEQIEEAPKSGPKGR